MRKITKTWLQNIIQTWFVGNGGDVERISMSPETRADAVRVLRDIADALERGGR